MTKSETQRIYESIFRTSAPEPIEKHFEIISKTIESRFSVDEIDTYRRCIEKVHDLEALEIAARHFKRIPVLTEKFKIMVYLAETLPENYHVFINEQNRFFSALISLTASILRTGYKVLKGMVIMVVNRI